MMPVQEQISYLQYYDLNPGDVIATGSPDGTGKVLAQNVLKAGTS